MAAMCGWFSDASTRASRSNRASRSRSALNVDGSTLIATARPSRVSRARYTSPIPPAPSAPTISYGPRRDPTARTIPPIIGELALPDRDRGRVEAERVDHRVRRRLVLDGGDARAHLVAP